MNEYTVKLAKPHCNNCGKIRVKGSDGKSHYVKKLSNTILSDIASESSQNLRSRLGDVTGEILEDDI